MHRDPIVQSHREQIASLDDRLLDLLNQRVSLVRSLKAHKDAVGHPFHDPAQEARLLRRLEGANPGPLSAQGLREIFSLILRWAKQDAAAQPEDPGRPSR